jgi:hypothetical protein
MSAAAQLFEVYLLLKNIISHYVRTETCNIESFDLSFLA